MRGERSSVGFSLVGRLEGEAGERERWEDAFELDVSADERDALERVPLSFQGRRLLRPSDRRVELALVTEGASVVLEADIEPAAILSCATRAVSGDARSLPFVVDGTLLVPCAADAVASVPADRLHWPDTRTGRGCR